MPADPPQTVGAMLRTAREAQGLSVNDIAERTRIRSTLIREIESDNFFGCGDTFYARGHVRSIAATVGADPVEALSRFDAAHHQDAPEVVTSWLPKYDPKAKAPAGLPPKQRNLAGGAGSAQTARVASSAAKPRRLWRPKRSSPSWTSGLIGAAVVILLLAAASWLIGNGQRAPHPNAAEPVPSLSPSKAPPAKPSPSPSPAPAAGLNLRIQATSGSSYVRVTTSSGATVYEGVMDKGQVKDVRDPSELKVRFGNSRVVEVLVNGVNRGAPACGAVVCSVTYKLDEQTA